MDTKSFKEKHPMKDYLGGLGINVTYGKPFICPNPNHEDSKPSCVVYDNTGGEYIKCFACDLQGDIFNLVKVIENLPTFSAQIKFLEQKYGKQC